MDITKIARHKSKGHNHKQGALEKIMATLHAKKEKKINLVFKSEI